MLPYGPCLPSLQFLTNCWHITSAFGDRMVTVKVGFDATAFFAHKSLLTLNSGFFKSTLASNAKESDTETKELPEDDPEAFQYVLRWLNTGKLFDISEDPDITDAFPVLTEIFAFGDARNMPALRNAAIDNCIDLIAEHWTIPMSEIATVYARTSEPSALRRLLVDFLVLSVDDIVSVLKENREYVVGEFAFDVACKLAAQKSGPMLEKRDWEEMNKGEYHDHILPSVCSHKFS
ncbi:hypothetical protein LTS18_000808, partial [Coniosporium uncinatum]